MLTEMLPLARWVGRIGLARRRRLPAEPKPPNAMMPVPVVPVALPIRPSEKALTSRAVGYAGRPVPWSPC